jgi:hypothetical protein
VRHSIRAGAEQRYQARRSFEIRGCAGWEWSGSGDELSGVHSKAASQFNAGSRLLPYDVRGVPDLPRISEPPDQVYRINVRLGPRFIGNFFAPVADLNEKELKH